MRRPALHSLVALIVFAGQAAGLAAQEPVPAAQPSAVDSVRGSLDSLRVQSVVEAERDFARASAELGIREGFLRFLADDAVVFTPRATNGPEQYRNAPPSDAVLEWQPVIAETALSDDLGYTTGPYTLRAAPNAPVDGRGWYFTVWRRNAEGVWQVVLDMGTATAAAPEATAAVEVPSRDPVPPGDVASRTARLLELDDMIAAAAQRRSARRAVSTALSVDARHNDAGVIVQGGVLVARTLPDTAVSYSRLGHGVSGAGDLAYTYGEYTVGEQPSVIEPTGNWLRVWRIGLDGQWSIIQLVTAPIPR
ncbi:MAG: YybH family protein [Longimicrobiales bacterium]